MNNTIQDQLLTGFKRFPSVSLQVVLQLSKDTLHSHYQTAYHQLSHLVKNEILLETKRSDRLMPVYRLTQQGMVLTKHVKNPPWTKTRRKDFRNTESSGIKSCDHANSNSSLFKRTQ